MAIGVARRKGERSVVGNTSSLYIAASIIKDTLPTALNNHPAGSSFKHSPIPSHSTYPASRTQLRRPSHFTRGTCSTSDRMRALPHPLPSQNCKTYIFMRPLSRVSSLPILSVSAESLLR